MLIATVHSTSPSRNIDKVYTIIVAMNNAK